MRLDVEGLDQHYGSAQVLRSISFEVPSGSCLALLGRNGAGKTTLLRCLAGVLAPSRGAVRFDGREVGAWPSHARCRAGLGYVPQGREIFPELTVGENIEVARRAQGVTDKAAVEEVLELFPILKSFWRRRGGALSGGQQQQLAIARALVGRPGLLLLDEPTEGIQPSIVQAIEDVIARLKGRMTIVLVEQYVDFAKTLADSFCVLSRGQVVAQGRGADLDAKDLQRHLAL